MATRRKRTAVKKVSKAIPRKFEGFADLLAKLEVETEKVVRRFVERAEQSSRDIKKGIAAVIDQVRSEGLASVASNKTEDLRRLAEDVIARAKDLQFLPTHFNRDEIIREAKKNLDDLIDRLSTSDLLAKAKATALNTKDQVLSILSIPNQSEVVKLSRKITSLESRVNKLTRKAA
jgi:sugar-specific transcriptional regulator TrmB